MMACQRCGKCCKYAEFRLQLPAGSEETIKWWKLHGCDIRELGQGKGLFSVMIDNTCAWYDPINGCTHYQDRPKVCRDFLCEVAKIHEPKI